MLFFIGVIYAFGCDETNDSETLVDSETSTLSKLDSESETSTFTEQDTDKPTEMVDVAFTGNYQIKNSSNHILSVIAFNLVGVKVDLINDSIPLNSTVPIYKIVSAAGGHVYPSNAFSKFVVEYETGDGALVVYDRVMNDDWKMVVGVDENESILTLTISNEMITESQL